MGWSTPPKGGIWGGGRPPARDFVVEHAMKQIPVITEEMTHSLEDRIRRPPAATVRARAPAGGGGGRSRAATNGWCYGPTFCRLVGLFGRPSVFRLFL